MDKCSTYSGDRGLPNSRMISHDAIFPPFCSKSNAIRYFDSEIRVKDFAGRTSTSSGQISGISHGIKQVETLEIYMTVSALVLMMKRLDRTHKEKFISKHSAVRKSSKKSIKSSQKSRSRFFWTRKRKPETRAAQGFANQTYLPAKA